MEERIFFNEGGVSVSNARFIVNGQTYAMNAVTSVKQGVNHPSHAGPFIFGLLGLIVSAAGFQVHSGGGAAWSQDQVSAVVIGFILVAAAIFWGYQEKSEYIVVLSTSSGESQALKSNDRLHVESIIGALNQSIVHRG